ncbi:ATP-dependent DNA helicase [Venturia nashicola]|uniref:ATP-dependent DNA helicase n=1 Tax=Venturia nashicola TaxID=86259 RepID=A0A4Z1P760_9PEZI|nr:ATP-dependent DNA helicase [Venturia nashicola]
MVLSWQDAFDILSTQSTTQQTNMPLSLYDTSVPAFIHGLTSLSHILTIAEEYAAESFITEAEIMESRLAPDMHPFQFQIWTVCNTAKNALVRVTGMDELPVADDQTTFHTMQARIKATIGILEGVKRESFDGAEGKEVTMTVAKQAKKFTGLSYLTTFAIPNFYFHIMVAYSILRMTGVPIGKGDYLAGGQK